MTDDTYIRRAYAAAAERDAGQSAWLQALQTLYESLFPCLEEEPAWVGAGLPERLGEPERAVHFPICWTDSRGHPRQTRGFFIQHCTVLGPWQGTAVFRRGLDLSTAKALALDNTLCYSLAGLGLGGGCAGADADTRVMDDGECRRFCRRFMEQLWPLLPSSFRPRLWEGRLPRRELGFLTGRYRQLAALTDTPPEPARRPGLLSRQQAAGWGLCRMAELALRRQAGTRLEEQTVLLAGRDGAAGWAGELAARMGARVIAAGDGTGYLYAAGGLPLHVLRSMAAQPELPLLLWAIRSPGVEYRPGPGLWEVHADAAFLFGGARLDSAGARQLLAGPCAGAFEGVPGAVTAAAARILAGSGRIYVPAMAAGAGGELLSALDGSASSWQAERQLRGAMERVWRTLWAESERRGQPGELLSAACSAAFRPLAAAILERGA